VVNVESVLSTKTYVHHVRCFHIAAPCLCCMCNYVTCMSFSKTCKLGNLTTVREMSGSWPEVWGKSCHGNPFITGFMFGAVPVFSGVICECLLYCLMWRGYLHRSAAKSHIFYVASRLLLASAITENHQCACLLLLIWNVPLLQIVLWRLSQTRWLRSGRSTCSLKPRYIWLMWVFYRMLSIAEFSFNNCIALCAIITSSMT